MAFDLSKIKEPRRNPNSQIEKILSKLPRDGSWQLVKQTGQSTAEQAARNLNGDSDWVFGYLIDKDSSGDLVGYLFARSI